MNPRLLFVVNEAGFFLSHRLPLALAARDAGYDVHVATGSQACAVRLSELHFEHHPLPMSRSGKNLLAELRCLVALLILMRRIKPTVVHLVTIKPVLYGGIAARMARVPAVVAAISGLGLAFSGTGWKPRVLRLLVSALYRQALKHRNLRVIFQNPTDRQMLIGANLVAPVDSTLIPGSGVDLSEYPHTAERPPAPAIVVMAARLLKDKGVFEFVGAARQLRKEGLAARFLLAGDPDPGNPTSVALEDIEDWKSDGAVEVLGFRSDIAALFSAAHIVVLPSYYEGLPKVLVEAAACGRPVVTTDVSGCRDAIEPNVSGLLVPPRDIDALSAAIRRLVEDSTLRQRMGAAGRRLAERTYSVDRIASLHLQVYRALQDAQTAGQKRC